MELLTLHSTYMVIMIILMMAAQVQQTKAAHITFNLHGDHDSVDDGGASATNHCDGA
jgi:hypothetical protein